MPNVRTCKSNPTFPAAANQPDFLVGQDRSGHWLALETRGRAGGIFASKDAAVHYAVLETSHRPEAVHITVDPIEFRI